jgi:ABC-type multidrug transport system fused ATPase/permease subunit
MKNKSVKVAIVVFLILVSAFHINAAIPVNDSLATMKVINDLVEILAEYVSEIDYYKEIIEIKDKYIREMRGIIYRSESLFNAVTYFPKTIPGQFDLNSYFFDKLKKNTWGELFKTDGRIEDKYPEFGDFRYITQNPLYSISERFRKYADEVLRFKQEEKQEIENEFEIIKLMKEFQQERAELLDRFKDVIVPAFGSAKNEKEEKKVVDVTRLYYAIAMAKLEALKQKSELLLMEKELMENYIKKEVNTTRYRMLNIKYQNYNEEN